MDKNDYQGYYDSIWEEIEPHKRTEPGARHREGKCDRHFRISTSGNCVRCHEPGIVAPADICLITVLSGS